MQNFEKISFSKGFEETIVELFISLLGSDVIEREKKITKDGKVYIADMVINNTCIVEIKYLRNKKIPIYYVEDWAEKIKCFLVNPYDRAVIVISGEIDDESRGLLKKKYINVELIDKVQLLKISEPFRDLHRKIISYFNAVGG